VYAGVTGTVGFNAFLLVLHRPGTSVGSGVAQRQGCRRRQETRCAIDDNEDRDDDVPGQLHPTVRIRWSGSEGLAESVCVSLGTRSDLQQDDLRMAPDAEWQATAGTGTMRGESKTTHEGMYDPGKGFSDEYWEMPFPPLALTLYMAASACLRIWSTSGPESG
jgi:hypothetical protein